MLQKPIHDYCVFDTETTGLSTENDEVIEIAAVKVRGDKIVSEFTSFVNPQRPIPKAASKVNGITDAMVRDFPAMDIVLRRFFEFVGDDVLVGHNIDAFDVKFIERYVFTYGFGLQARETVDTLPLARRLVRLDRYSLAALAEHFDIDASGAHRALDDCFINQQVFACLQKKLLAGSRNQDLVEGVDCPRCGAPLRRMDGKFGPFLGCTAYPKCRCTKSIKRWW